MHGQSNKINPSRCHVFADGTRPYIKLAAWSSSKSSLCRRCTCRRFGVSGPFFSNVTAMLHFFAEMRIPFNAKASNKANCKYIGLARCGPCYGSLR